jgi:hypothetical protein
MTSLGSLIGIAGVAAGAALRGRRPEHLVR